MKQSYEIPEVNFEINALAAGIKRPIKVGDFDMVIAHKNTLQFIRNGYKPFWVYGLKDPLQILESIKNAVKLGRVRKDGPISLHSDDMLSEDLIRLKYKSFKEAVEKGIRRKNINTPENLFIVLAQYLKLSLTDFHSLINGNIPDQFNSKDGKDILVLCFSLILGSPSNFKNKRLYWTKVFKKFIKIND